LNNSYVDVLDRTYYIRDSVLTRTGPSQITPSNMIRTNCDGDMVLDWVLDWVLDCNQLEVYLSVV